MEPDHVLQRDRGSCNALPADKGSLRAREGAPASRGQRRKVLRRGKYPFQAPLRPKASMGCFSCLRCTSLTKRREMGRSGRLLR